MADEAQKKGYLLPNGFLGLKSWETPEDAYRRKKQERDQAAADERARQVAEATAPAPALAPKRDGGLNGIVTAVVDESGNAIVAGITQVDRLFAANPPDP